MTGRNFGQKRLFLLPFLPKTQSARRPRAKKVAWRKVDVSFRRFYTHKQNRTKLYHQLVFPLRVGGYKEVAITLRVARSQSHIFNTGQLLPISLILMGVLGSMFFMPRLSTPRNLQPKVLPATNTTVQAAPAETPAMAPSQPTRLRIAKIDLDAEIIDVDLKADGSLAVPDSPSVAGWYKRSPAPGSVGPAIIDGHVDYIDNIAIFWRLRELSPGDYVEISRQDGSVAKFQIEQIKQYSQNNLQTNEVYGKTNYPALRLITCSGTFDSSTGHYSDNLVVFGRLVKS